MRTARRLLSPTAYDDDNAPIPVEGLAKEEPKAPEPMTSSKIRAFEQKLTSRHEDNWNRSPNVTGHGAIHCKSFHSKLTEESLHFLDQQINEWLDAHPQYEVKFVNSVIGDWSSKTGRDHNMIVQVWV